MKNVTLLKGLGSNELAIPCMVFLSFEAGMEYVSAILGQPNEQEEEDGCRVACWTDGNIEGLLEDDEIAQKFFTHYYGGCGECWGFELAEVEFGKPLVPWNLD